MGKKKPNPYREATEGYDDLQRGLSGEKRVNRERGSYDRKGVLIEGTQPKAAPRKPVAGSYDRRGKLIKAMTGK